MSRRVLALLLTLSALVFAPGLALAQNPMGTVRLQTWPKGATLLGNPTSTAVDANTQALDVAIKAGSVTISGTVGVTQSTSPWVTSFTAPQHVILDSGTLTTITNPVAVTGTFWQATQPVSLASVPSHDVTNAGTFAVQAAQAGTWTVQPGNTANTTAWLVTGTGGTFPVTGTFWQATQPISAASLPLPTGASTAAKQPALGTAGVASADVLTVQGIASMTALKVDGSAVTQPVSGTVTANAGTGNFTVVQGTGTNLHVVCDSGCSGGTTDIDDASIATGQTTGLSLSLGQVYNGAAWVRQTIGTAGTASAQVVTVQGIAGMTKIQVTPDSVALPANQSVNVSQINGVTPLMGNGVTGTGSHRVTIASDNTAFAVNATLSAETTKVIGTVRALGNAGAAFDAATAAAVPANALYMGANGSGNLKGVIACDNWTPINVSNTTATKLVTKATSKNVYICSINLVVAAASNVALIAGTKTTNECDTSTAGLAGGTTAATGWHLAANGGLTQGSGVGVVMGTASTGLDVCIVQSASTQLSGAISWTQF